MYNAKLYANIKNYGNYLVEQSAELSTDLNERLKQYLQFDGLVDVLSEKLQVLEDGEEVELDGLQDQGVDPEDKIYVRVDKSDVKNPKFTLWIMNEEYMFGGIDFNLAANILYQAGQEGNAITYTLNNIGTLFGLGDPGDAGTDEESVVGIMGAMVMLAKEKGLDPKLYFDKLKEAFESRHGSLVDFLETEFSGRAEAAALCAFRQPVESSVTRGLNMGQILFDIGLTIGTLGGGTVAKTALQGAAGAGRAIRYTKAAAATARTAEGAASATKLGRALQKMRSVFRLLPKSDKIAKMQKAFPVGSKLKYLTGTGKELDAIVDSYKGGKVFLKGTNGAFIGPSGIQIANLANETSKVSLAAGSLAKIIPSAKVSAGILAGDKTIGAIDAVDDGMPEEPGIVAKGAEIMNWYDTVTADPNLYVASLYGQGPAALADKILSLKKGSGFFGNTTNQEELCLALITISLTPDGAAEVQKEYQKLAGEKVYPVLDDELGGDLGLFAKAYWSACTGEGNLAALSSGMLGRIRSGE